ncbi:hypothetical protein OAU50_05335 [Planctomycetota bacterium]|nr:hypothetical protein [Planctomycetota bacterium]
MSLPQIEKKLDQLRGHIRLMFISFGLAKILIWAAGLTLWLYYTDRVLQLPGSVRVGFLVVSVIALIIIGVRSLVYPLSKTISDEDLALLVEREYPLLNDRLISSLQILKAQERYKDSASDDMMRHVVAESFDVAGKLKFEEAVRSKHLMKIVGISVFAMLMVFGHALFDRNDMSIWVQRVAGGGPDWPTRTQLVVHILDEDELGEYPTDDFLTVNFTYNPEAEIPELGVKGVYDVAESTDLRFIAIPTGDIPDDAELEVTPYQYDSAKGEFKQMGRPTVRQMVRNAGSIEEGSEEQAPFFSYNKMAMTTPFEKIMIRAGDAVDGPYYFRKIPAPALDSPLLFSFKYPEYLSIPDTASDQERSISAVQGTQVVIEFKTTKQLLLDGRDASALIVDYAVGSSQEFKLDTDNAASTEGSYGYKVTIPGLRLGMSQYRLRLIDRQGISANVDIGDTIDVAEDAAPTVQIGFSGDPLISNQLVYVVPDAIVPIEFEMSDDYGVGSAGMFWRLNTDDEFTEFEAFGTWFKEQSPKPTTAFAGTFELNFKQLLQETVLPDLRNSIEVKIQAFDLNQVKGKDGELLLQGSRADTRMTYELYSIDELRTKVSSQIRQIKTTISSMLNLQQDLLVITSEALEPRTPLDFKNEEGVRLRTDLNDAYQKQNQLLRDAEVVLARFSVFAQVYQFNRLERSDAARPQETHIQNVRLLSAIVAAERELQQTINNSLMRLEFLEDAEDEDLKPHADDVIKGLGDTLHRALPTHQYSRAEFGKIIQDAKLYSPGSFERARAQYEAMLEVGAKPQDRRDMLTVLKAQQVLSISALQAIQGQVKKWEGFDDVLHGFRNLLKDTKDINDDVKKEVE